MPTVLWDPKGSWISPSLKWALAGLQRPGQERTVFRLSRGKTKQNAAKLHLIMAYEKTRACHQLTLKLAAHVVQIQVFFTFLVKARGSSKPIFTIVKSSCSFFAPLSWRKRLSHSMSAHPRTSGRFWIVSISRWMHSAPSSGSNPRSQSPRRRRQVK